MNDQLTEIYNLFIKTAKEDYLDDSNQKRLEVLSNVFIHLSDLEFERENQNKRTETIEKATEKLTEVFANIIFSEKGEK